MSPTVPSPSVGRAGVDFKRPTAASIVVLISGLLVIGVLVADVSSAGTAAQAEISALQPSVDSDRSSMNNDDGGTAAGTTTAVDTAPAPTSTSTSSTSSSTTSSSSTSTSSTSSSTTPTTAQPVVELPAQPRLGVAYGPDPAHLLDVHPPASPNGLAVLWLHPGGWAHDDRTRTGPVVDQLTAAGAIVFSADYRLAPTHTFPAQIHDVKRAIRWIKANRSEFPHQRLVVAGASAGGHLAALAATSAGDLEPTGLPAELAAHDSSVDGAVSLAGPMDLTRFWQAGEWAKSLSDDFLGCDSATCDQTRMLQASPTHWVDPSDPPLFLAAGTADTLVTATDNADRMWDTIQTSGDPSQCWYDRVEGGTHNLDDTLDRDRLQRFLVEFGLVGSGSPVAA